MITFSQLGCNGRLGNQLFQYAALRSLALKNGYTAKVPIFKNQKWHNQDCLLNHFNIKAEPLDSGDLFKIEQIYRESNAFKIDKDFFSIRDNTELSGFFQSMFYFRDFETQIKEELTPKKEILQKYKDKISSLKQRYPNHETVSVHIRRGDNVHHLNGEQKKLENTYGDIESDRDSSFYFRYFMKAKQVFENKKVKFLIFVGGSRSSSGSEASDVSWCKGAFAGDEFLFLENQDSMGDFCSIMSCDHNIACPISSFGWWAAYLNPNPNKTVIAPINYHPDMPGYTHREMFYPQSWTIL